jgi:hypothetical protein
MSQTILDDPYRLDPNRAFDEWQKRWESNQPVAKLANEDYELIARAIVLARGLYYAPDSTLTDYEQGCTCIQCSLVRSVEQMGLLGEARGKGPGALS